MTDFEDSKRKFLVWCKQLLTELESAEPTKLFDRSRMSLKNVTEAAKELGFELPPFNTHGVMKNSGETTWTWTHRAPDNQGAGGYTFETQRNPDTGNFREIHNEAYAASFKTRAINHLWLWQVAVEAMSAPTAEPHADEPMTELLTKQQIAKYFDVGRNAVDEILANYHHTEILGKIRMRVSDMPPAYQSSLAKK